MCFYLVPSEPRFFFTFLIYGVFIPTPFWWHLLVVPFGGCLARAWARVRARAATRARDPCAYGIYTVPNMTQIVAYLGFIPLH